MIIIGYLPDNPDHAFMLANSTDTALEYFTSVRNARREIRLLMKERPELERAYFKIFKEVNG